MNGFIYVATDNDEYDKMARNSVRSLQRVSSYANWVILRGAKPGYLGRELKLLTHCYTHFGITCYVDADTFFDRDLPLEKLLGAGHFAAALDPFKTVGAAAAHSWPEDHVSRDEIEETLDVCGPDFPFLNGGVFIYRRSIEANTLFRRWLIEWNDHQRCDQFALARALKNTGTVPVIMPETCNSFVRAGELLDPNAVLHHFIEGDKIASMRRHGRWMLPDE